jgi:hypothetical protein
VREPQSAGDALQRLLERLGLDRQLRTYRALMHWDAVVGVHLAQVARPLRVDADTLWVAVKSHAWVQELTFHKRTILQRLNAHIGEERFREVRFTVRAQLPTVFEAADGEAESTPPPEPPQLSEAELAEVEANLQGISDPALRDALRRAQLATLRYQKQLEQRGWRKCPMCECYHRGDSAVCFLCERGG